MKYSAEPFGFLFISAMLEIVLRDVQYRLHIKVLKITLGERKNEFGLWSLPEPSHSSQRALQHQPIELELDGIWPS